MTSFSPLPAPSLAPQVQQALDGFLKSAQDAFGNQLRSVVLFGSAAEGKLRPTSDINIILVLSAFEQEQAAGLRQPLRVAHAAIQLRPMFLLSAEIPGAVCFFAPKFADILRRRFILYGEDPFESVSVPREAEIQELKQQLLNMTLRLRSVYVARSLRDEQLAAFVASAIGPLRSMAAALLEVEGQGFLSPQQAFERLGAELCVPNWQEVLSVIETVQGGRLCKPGTIERLFFQLLAVVRLATVRAEALSNEVAR